MIARANRPPEMGANIPKRGFAFAFGIAAMCYPMHPVRRRRPVGSGGGEGLVRAVLPFAAGVIAGSRAPISPTRWRGRSATRAKPWGLMPRATGCAARSHRGGCAARLLSVPGGKPRDRECEEYPVAVCAKVVVGPLWRRREEVAPLRDHPRRCSAGEHTVASVSVVLGLSRGCRSFERAIRVVASGAVDGGRGSAQPTLPCMTVVRGGLMAAPAAAREVERPQRERRGAGGRRRSRVRGAWPASATHPHGGSGRHSAAAPPSSWGPSPGLRSAADGRESAPRGRRRWRPTEGAAGARPDAPRGPRGNPAAPSPREAPPSFRAAGFARIQRRRAGGRRAAAVTRAAELAMAPLSSRKARV